MRTSGRKQTDYRVDLLPLFAGLAFFLIGALITVSMGGNVTPISNSVKTKWGIVTSNFIFDGIGNVELYLMYLSFLWLSSLPYLAKTRKQRYLSSVYSMFTSAIIANGIWLFADHLANSNITSGGESAVVFGFAGACLSLFLIDSIINLSGFVSSKALDRKSGVDSLKTERRSLRQVGGFLSPFFSIIMISDLAYGRTAFFDEFPKVNYFVHILAFSAGFLISAVIYSRALYRFTRKTEIVSVKDLKDRGRSY